MASEERNAFSILGRARQALRSNGYGNLINEFTDKCVSGNYDNLLAVCAEYFEVY